MKIYVNRQEVETSAQTVAALIATTPMAGKPVVVEVNERAIVASAHATTTLTAGDRVEVLVLGAGG